MQEDVSVKWLCYSFFFFFWRAKLVTSERAVLAVRVMALVCAASRNDS